MQKISDTRVRLTVDEARALSEQTLCRRGYDEEEARILTDHMIDAALCGYEYSGLPKVLNIAESPRQLKPRRHIRTVRETPVSALLDGGNNNGMIAVYRATQVAISKASEHGFAVVGMNNTWMSGRSAYYVEMAARAGLICIHTVSTTRNVAPPGAAVAATGTNPIAFGFPTAGEPLVIDMGTSAFMGTELQLFERLGKPLPEGVAIDAQGNPTRDAAKVSAILSFGGYKGFALALASQALGVFAGSATDAEKIYGYMVLAMKPDLLVPMADYRRDMSVMLAELKATPRQPGVDEIRLPGERSLRERAKNLKAGLEIDRKIYDALVNFPEGTLSARD